MRPITSPMQDQRLRRRRATGSSSPCLTRAAISLSRASNGMTGTSRLRRHRDRHMRPAAGLQGSAEALSIFVHHFPPRATSCRRPYWPKRRDRINGPLQRRKWRGHALFQIPLATIAVPVGGCLWPACGQPPSAIPGCPSAVIQSPNDLHGHGRGCDPSPPAAPKTAAPAGLVARMRRNELRGLS